MTQEIALSEALSGSLSRLRRDRNLSAAQLAGRLEDLGAGSLNRSVIANIESGRRRYVTIDELAGLSIALNVSIIDLLTPPTGAALRVAENVDPLAPEWLEAWLRGDTPWPPTADRDEFFSAASVSRQSAHQLGLRPEMLAISELRSAVRGAIEGPGPSNEIDDPKVMADYLRECSERAQTYVRLLADQLEKNGYGR